jgi:hypothetical protein
MYAYTRIHTSSRGSSQLMYTHRAVTCIIIMSIHTYIRTYARMCTHVCVYAYTYKQQKVSTTHVHTQIRCMYAYSDLHWSNHKGEVMPVLIMHECACVCVCVRVRARMCVCVCVCICICIYIYIYTYIHVYICIHTCMHAYTHTCVFYA